jgi:TIR domain
VDPHQENVQGAASANWDVFISYSSKDVDQAIALEKALTAAGKKVWRDKTRLEAGEHVGSAIPKALRAAEAVVVIWSNQAAVSSWVRWEAGYAAAVGKLACLHVDGFSPGTLDSIFRDYHSEPLTDTLAGAGNLLSRLDKLKAGRKPLAERFVGITHLPQTFSAELFGRTDELAQLIDAWHSERTHVVALDAIGGAGKTALVRQFMQMLEEGGWRGAERVFVWSFYSQGTDANRQGDADPFYIAALTFFGYEREVAEEEARKQAGRKPTQREIELAQLALIRRELPSPAEKGRELARLVRQHRTLLFLDGMEPLQYPAGRTGGGHRDTGVSGALKDKGMTVLLRELAMDNPGLAIVTTRIKLKDLREFPKPAVLPIPLTALAEASAIELLTARGVTGSRRHLVALANDLRGHALALNLVAQYLVTHHRGDARRADLLPDLAQVGGDDERDPYRVMSAYEIEFKKEIARQLNIVPGSLLQDKAPILSEEALSTPAGKQLALLYMLGLFDQPVPRDVFDALIAPPAILGFTDGIAEAHKRSMQWNEAIARLRDQGLISRADADRPSTLDCHPLVREYFGLRLKQIDRTAFKAAHSRLYDHYRYVGLPNDVQNSLDYAALRIVAAFPENRRDNQRALAVLRKASERRGGAAIIDRPDFEEVLKLFRPREEASMTPLFAAIAHGCAAEREEEAFNEVYWPRIAHGSEAFAAQKLGLYSQELAALASFFEAPFTAPSPRLAAGNRAWVLNAAGDGLRALGRLEDAATPFRVAVGAYAELNDQTNASLCAGNLSELVAIIGRLSGEAGAVAAGESAVSFADRSGDAYPRMSMRATQAYALLQAGALAQAGAIFREAEAQQKAWQPSLPRLYSQRGYRYCDGLLARGRAAEAARRANANLPMATRHELLLDMGLDSLTQARAALAAIPPSALAPQDCAPRAEQALAALRRANQEAHIVPGLLTHAEALWRCGDAEAADEPLREAEDIAALGPMPLFITQAHLLRACIALSQCNFTAACEKREAAAALIKKHGYGRGAVELTVLDAEFALAANASDGDKTIAAALKAVAGEPYYDKRTKRTISGGWFGLLPRLEAILPPGHAGLAQLQAARDAYNAERDDYLRSTLARDVEDYDPADDPIAAYLAARRRRPRLSRWLKL